MSDIAEETVSPAEQHRGSMESTTAVSATAASPTSPTPQQDTLTCPTCGKLFVGNISSGGLRSNYNRHLLTHAGGVGNGTSTESRPYKCTGCDLTFTTSSNLKRHVQRRHPELMAVVVGSLQRRVSSGGTSSSAVSRRRLQQQQQQGGNSSIVSIQASSPLGTSSAVVVEGEKDEVDEQEVTEAASNGVSTSVSSVASSTTATVTIQHFVTTAASTPTTRVASPSSVASCALSSPLTATTTSIFMNVMGRTKNITVGSSDGGWGKPSTPIGSTSGAADAAQNDQNVLILNNDESGDSPPPSPYVGPQTEERPLHPHPAGKDDIPHVYDMPEPLSLNTKPSSATPSTFIPATTITVGGNTFAPFFAGIATSSGYSPPLFPKQQQQQHGTPTATATVDGSPSSTRTVETTTTTSAKSASASSSTSSSLHLCPFEGCKRQFVWRNSLTQHIHLHHREVKDEFICDACQSVLSSMTKLRRHQREHCPFRDDCAENKAVPVRFVKEYGGGAGGEANGTDNANDRNDSNNNDDEAHHPNRGTSPSADPHPITGTTRLRGKGKRRRDLRQQGNKSHAEEEHESDDGNFTSETSDDDDDDGDDEEEDDDDFVYSSDEEDVPTDFNIKSPSLRPTTLLQECTDGGATDLLDKAATTTTKNEKNRRKHQKAKERKKRRLEIRETIKEAKQSRREEKAREREDDLAFFSAATAATAAALSLSRTRNVSGNCGLGGAGEVDDASSDVCSTTAYTAVTATVGGTNEEAARRRRGTSLSSMTSHFSAFTAGGGANTRRKDSISNLLFATTAAAAATVAIPTTSNAASAAVSDNNNNVEKTVGNNTLKQPEMTTSASPLSSSSTAAAVVVVVERVLSPLEVAASSPTLSRHLRSPASYTMRQFPNTVVITPVVATATQSSNGPTFPPTTTLDDNQQDEEERSDSVEIEGEEMEDSTTDNGTHVSTSANASAHIAAHAMMCEQFVCPFSTHQSSPHGITPTMTSSSSSAITATTSCKARPFAKRQGLLAHMRRHHPEMIGSTGAIFKSSSTVDGDQTSEATAILTNPAAVEVETIDSDTPAVSVVDAVHAAAVAIDEENAKTSGHC